jgi:hypothetical protein
MKQKFIEVTLLLLMSLELQASERFLSALGCPYTGAEKIAQFESVAVLNQQFLEASQKQQLDQFLVEAKSTEVPQWLIEALKLQWKHSVGYFQHTQLLEKAEIMVPSTEDLEIEVLSIKKAQFFANLQIDDFRPSQDVKDTNYLNQALQKGKTSDSDPAFKISYRGKSRFYTCLKSETPLVQKVVLPLDPFLSFWYAPKSRRVVSTFGLNSNVISPCSNNEMADFGDATQFWWLWSPEEKNLDINKIEYSCEKSVDIRALTYPVKLIWSNSSTGPLTHEKSVLLTKNRIDKWRLQNKISVNLIIGVLDTDPKKRMPFDLFFADLPQITFEEAKFEKLWNQWTRKMEKKEIKREPGFIEMLSFLRHVNKVVKITKLKTKTLDEQKIYAEIQLEGVLLKSKKPIEIKITFGPTEVPKDKVAYHAIAFVDGIQNSDIALYAGHAGLGTYTNWVEIIKRPEVRELVKKPIHKAHQIIGLFSCNAYSYYSSTFHKLRESSLTDKSPSSTDLYVSSSKEGGSRFGYAILELVDDELANEKTLQISEIFRKFLISPQMIVRVFQ